MKTHDFTKILRSHIPIQLSICIPAFSGSRQIVVIWYIAPVKGHHEANTKCNAAELILLLEHLRLPFGGFDYVDFEYIHAGCFIIIINMILILLAGNKQLNLRGSARRRQPGRDNMSLCCYHLYYWLMSKKLQMRKLQVCNLETSFAELWVSPGANTELPFLSMCKCLLI